MDFNETKLRFGDVAIGKTAGVHLVITTSRPGAKIVSDGLKAEIPARLAFRVWQEGDSRMLLDEDGAEALLGQGDALFKDGKGTVVRLQAPFIRDEAVARIVDSAIVRYSGRWFADVVPMRKRVAE